MSEALLIGPFSQIITMRDLPLKGSLKDEDLEIITDGGILTNNGKIEGCGKYNTLLQNHPQANLHEINEPTVCVPGFIDAHTHICFAGSRSKDYAMRNGGLSYLEIAKAGGGIWDTVTQTRNATKDDLIQGIRNRAGRHIKDGITTIEVKSGYGLSVEEELKMLRAIKEANKTTVVDLVPTCLAAHILPKDFEGNHKEYLDEISSNLFPTLLEENLTNRIDAFIEEEAFNNDLTRSYFLKAQESGFKLTVHADQFHPGGSALAVEMNALSADHLEASTDYEIQLLANSDVISMALPGASIGLGVPFTPARKILDQGGALAIATDWNPGSGPMGQLITQASILQTYEKLSNAEVLAGITFRAAAALSLFDRGVIAPNYIADLACFPSQNFSEILYQQGSLKPNMIFKYGKFII